MEGLPGVGSSAHADPILKRNFVHLSGGVGGYG
jgi:hypothetical protein